MKCPYCKGKGTLPGFQDSPGDSLFIFCSACRGTGKVPTIAEELSELAKQIDELESKGGNDD